MNKPIIPFELERALGAFETEALDEIIEKKRPEDFQVLRSLIEASGANPELRQRAIYALGRWGDASAVPIIVKLLPDLEETHCITALEALGRLGTPDACDAVVSFADNDSPQIRKFVVSALGRIGSPIAVKRLRQMAKDDREVWVRELASKRVNT